MSRREECPFAITEKRLYDCINLSLEVKEKYFQPNSFRVSLNNCIQTLRTVTFVLQKSLSDLDTFSAWYAKWQEQMKADPVLKWLIEARNIIVKEGDLKTYSKVRIAYIESWLANPSCEMLAPLPLDINGLIKFFKDNKPNNLPDDVGLMCIERMWIDSMLPDEELSACIMHAVSFFSQMLLDGHNALLSDDQKKLCHWYSDIGNKRKFLPPCLIGQSWDRTIWVNLKDGSRVSSSAYEKKFKEGDIEKAAKRYSPIKTIVRNHGKINNFKESADCFFECAKAVLEKDGHHISIALVNYPDNKSVIYQLVMRNRQEKHLVIRNLANDIKRTGANSVILIGEVWTAKADKEGKYVHAVDAPDRKEALQLIAANSDGELYLYTVPYTKTLEGKILLGEQSLKTGPVPNIIDPIVQAWQCSRKSDTIA